MSGSRPAGVTVVAVIVLLLGLGQIVLGVLGTTIGLDLAGAGTVPVAQLVLGVITVIAGILLLRGNKTSRIIASVVLVLGVAVAAYSVITIPSNPWSAIVTGVLSLLGLLLLWTRKASAYFG